MRQAPWSHRSRVDVGLRHHLVNNVPTSSVVRAAVFCCYRSAPAVPFYWCRSDSANCHKCLTHNYRVSDFAHQHASTTLQFPSACRTFVGTFSPSRPSHVPPRAKLMPRRTYLSFHFFHPCSFPWLLIPTVICPPTPRVSSSISHHDFPFVKWSAKMCTPGTRFIFTLPGLVISCSHRHFNSICLVFPSPLHEAIDLAALE